MCLDIDATGRQNIEFAAEIVNCTTWRQLFMNHNPQIRTYRASALAYWIGWICKITPRGKGAIARFLGRLLRPAFKDRFITTRYGAKLVINYRNLDFYATMFRWDNSWEHWVFDTAHWLLPDQGTFYDIGANVGYMGLEMLQRKPLSKLVCFEPIPALASLNRQSIRLNGFDSRAQVFECALSDVSKADQPLSIPEHQGHASLESEFEQPGSDRIQVQLRRLDDLVAEQHLPLPDVIKIDVEGHEVPALTGALETLSASQPHVLFEANNDEQFKEVKNILAGVADYQYFYANGSYRPLLPVADKQDSGHKFDVIAINIQRDDLPQDVIVQLHP